MKNTNSLLADRLLTFQEHSATFLNSVLRDPAGPNFFEEALRHAVELIPAAQSGSILLRGSDDLFHFISAHNFAMEDLAEVTFNDKEVFFGFDPTSDSFIVDNIELINNQLDEHRQDILKNVGKADEILSTLVVPLTVDERAFAFFTLDSFESRTAFTPDDQTLAEMFAVNVAVVIRLLDYNTLFREVFYNVPYATLIANQDLTITAANATFERLTSLEAEGKALRDLPLLKPNDLATLEDIKSGERLSWETELLEGAGGYWCRLNVQQVTLDQPLYLLTFLDLTETRESEENLRQVITDLSADSFKLMNSIRSKLETIRPSRTPPPNFSERESQLLSHLASGFTNSQMATILNLSNGTVNNNLTALYEKIGVNNRFQAGLWARERGFE